MLTKEILAGSFDAGTTEALWAYVNNKNIGGKNNGKGNRLENHFAVYKLATLINEQADINATLISAQLKTFIDDLIIEKTSLDEIEYYQIKDVQDLAWTASSNALEDDVRNQFQVCEDSGKKPTISIVVSKEELQQKLERNLPATIEHKVTVQHFPAASTVNNLIRASAPFKNSLQSICAIENPATDKLDTVGSILLGVWGSIDPNRVPLKTYIEKCFALNPNYFRGGSNKVSEKLALILEKVPDFSYTVKNGVLEWKYKESDNGFLSFRVGTKEFEQWENDIFQIHSVNTFDDIEGYLV